MIHIEQWIEISRLVAFIPLFWVASLTPGLCMTLSMSLGMAVGFKRTLWMMLGELAGVALLAILTALGVASLISGYHLFFLILKIFGVCYLIYVGVSMLKVQQGMQLNKHKDKDISTTMLITQGFMTAVSNPKGWLFFIALIPPALNPTYSLFTQLAVLIIVIVLIEFSSLCIYAISGSSMRQFLQKERHVQWLYRIAGIIIIFVALWLLKN